MAWRTAKRATPIDDSQVLRAGLVQLLETLAAGTVPGHAKEIRTLADRLTEGPTPSGLGRELTRLFGDSGVDGDPAEAFAETARAMGDAMAQVAMSEEALERNIQQLQAMVPPRVQPHDAKGLTAKARALEDAAVPIRRRVLSAQGETALILEAVSHALAGSETSSGRIAKNAGQLARAFAEANDDAALRAMRGQITQALQVLVKDANKLEQRMTSAKARTRDLERRVEKQAAILGVLDSCRRIRKELERYGDEDEGAIEAVKAPKGLWDSLTGVYSRETHDRLAIRASQAADDTQRPLCLVLVEIENLPRLARMYGEPARDTVIKTLGRQLTEVVLETDVLSRVGDGRFALLLPATGLESAKQRSAKARDVLKRVAFASRSGRFHVKLRTSAVERRYNEAPDALEQRAAVGLDPVVKPKRRR